VDGLGTAHTHEREKKAVMRCDYGGRGLSRKVRRDLTEEWKSNELGKQRREAMDNDKKADDG